MINKFIKLLRKYKILYFVIIVSILSISSCASHKPAGMKILASIPMENSCISCYPTIETIYESDPQITLVVYWEQISRSENTTLRWVINDHNGRAIFESVNKDITLQPYMLFSLTIELDRGENSKLVPGTYKANIYIDEQLSAYQNVQYVTKSIHNKNVQQAVILLFKETTLESNLIGDTKPVIINTISHAIYSEVKRIIPDTIPHYIVEQKIGKLLKSNCFENIKCVDLIKNTFGESIFILGNIELVKYEGDLAEMMVNVYNSKTGDLKKFFYTSSAVDSYDDLIHDLLKGVMQKEGFLDYLEKCK